jgi:hypothetical protein
MAHVLKVKKVKPKGRIIELKVVHSITRRGLDTVTTEEVRTPRRDGKKASSSKAKSQSSSPAKRPKLDGFDAEPLPFDLEGLEDNGKRQTLVFILL